MQPAHNLVRDKHSRPGFVEIDNPDARLIAAAPDLLAALKGCLTFLPCGGVHEEAALSAIADAETV